MARGRGRRGRPLSARGEGRGRPVTQPSAQASPTPEIPPQQPIASSQVPIPPLNFSPEDMARFYATMFANITTNPYFMAQQNAPTGSGTHNQTPTANPTSSTVPLPPQTTHVTVNAPQLGDSLLLEYMKEFARLQPLNFTGSTGPESAESWLYQIGKNMRVFVVPDKYKVQLATSRLTALASSWWRV